MPARPHDDLTIAVIHFQTPDLLERCLQAVRRAAPAARLLVVDTGEGEPLPASWQDENPGVELVRQVNHSYAAAVNAGLARCRTPRFVQMNADVFVSDGTFDALAEALEKAGAVMSGPLARDEAGRMQRNGLPYRVTQALARAQGAAEAPWLSGFLHYVDARAAEESGGMDESLRFYNEDLEWCLRLRRAGGTCVLVDHEVVHVGGASTLGTPAQLVEGMRGAYQVSVQYRPPAYRALHRWTMFAYTGLMAAMGPPALRGAYRYLNAMFASGEPGPSPFGDTLGTIAPAFADSVGAGARERGGVRA